MEVVRRSGPGMWSGCVSAKVTFEQKLEEEKERTYLGAVPQAGDTVSAKALGWEGEGRAQWARRLEKCV